MDGGEEAIADDAVLQQVRRQARRVHIRSLVAAVLLTGLVLLV
jgi:hypothetical protein